MEVGTWFSRQRAVYSLLPLPTGHLLGDCRLQSTREASKMPTRFFITVIAPTKQMLLNLAQFDLDLFQPTAKVSERQKFEIEGLMTLDEVERLVRAGYHVLVREEASQKARAQA